MDEKSGEKKVWGKGDICTKQKCITGWTSRRKSHYTSPWWMLRSALQEMLADEAASTLNDFYIQILGKTGSATKLFSEPSVRQKFSSLEWARSWDFRKIRPEEVSLQIAVISECLLDLKEKSVGQGSGRRAALVQGIAAQDMNHGSEAVTSCYASAVCFSCSFSPGALSRACRRGCQLQTCQQEPGSLTNPLPSGFYGSHQLEAWSEIPAGQKLCLMLTLIFCRRDPCFVKHGNALFSFGYFSLAFENQLRKTRLPHWHTSALM